ncbi:MAG: hypothetical protein EBU84_11770 [Actinobacteria bacterium]|nr:hypothetical protein [Actinomycetota bacterium]
MQNISDSETLQVNALTCTYGEYRQLPTREDRLALRDRIVNALVEAYRRDDDSPVRATHRFPYQFDQDFDRWEASVETPMDELRRRLKYHDWYYDRSDDHRSWTAGRNNQARILSLVNQLGDEGKAAYDAARSNLR